MVSAKAVKTTAKALLKGNWANSVVISAIPLLCAAVIYIVTYLLSLPLGDFSVIIALAAYLFLIAPLWLGTLRCFWRMANEIKDSPFEVFYFFSALKSYKRALAFSLKIMLRIFICFTVFFLPSIIVQLLTNEYFYEFFGMATPIWVLSFRPVFYVLRFAGFVAAVAYICGILLPSFLLLANEEMSTGDCIKQGIEIGKIEKSNLAAIVWSYMGWILLSFLVVPLLFTLPYLLMSYIVACRFSVVQHNLRIDKANEIPTHEV